MGKFGSYASLAAGSVDSANDLLLIDDVSGVATKRVTVAAILQAANTAGKIAKFSASTGLADSLLTETTGADATETIAASVFAKALNTEHRFTNEFTGTQTVVNANVASLWHKDGTAGNSAVRFLKPGASGSGGGVERGAIGTGAAGNYLDALFLEVSNTDMSSPAGPIVFLQTGTVGGVYKDRVRLTVDSGFVFKNRTEQTIANFSDDGSLFEFDNPASSGVNRAVDHRLSINGTPIAQISAYASDFAFGGLPANGMGLLAFQAGGMALDALAGPIVLATGGTPDTNTRITIRLDGVTKLHNVTAPADTASGGGLLYSEAGALKWKGSGGTITTLGAA